MKIGANTSANAIFFRIFNEKQKRTSIKHFMKNKYLITKPSGKMQNISLRTSKITLVDKTQLQ